MKLECVIVCVNYGDFLAWTLPYNKQHFDNMVVVTSTDDIETQKLCEYWHVKCIKSDEHKEDGGFNKGALINVGLKEIDGDGWVVHLDADIYLPPHFRRVLEGLTLDNETVYGIDRMMCNNFNEWLKFLFLPAVQHENDIFVHPGPFTFGVRLSSSLYGGWIPLGFFQMWHQATKKLQYPAFHMSAARGDMQFASAFPRHKRSLLAEFIGIHLETSLLSLSDDASEVNEEMGINWNGRKTPKFGHNSFSV